MLFVYDDISTFAARQNNLHAFFRLKCDNFNHRSYYLYLLHWQMRDDQAFFHVLFTAYTNLRNLFLFSM